MTLYSTALKYFFRMSNKSSAFDNIIIIIIILFHLKKSWRASKENMFLKCVHF